MYTVIIDLGGLSESERKKRIANNTVHEYDETKGWKIDFSKFEKEG